MASSQNSLFAFFDTKLVGKIYLNYEDQFCFDYSQEWLAHPNAFPLSHSLPLANITYLDDAQTFFANLLPEGKVRKLIASRLRLSEENDYSLLKALGEDCAGAFSIFPSSELKQTSKPAYTPISLKEIAKTYKAQPIFYLGLENENIRLSLAGVQDKIPVLFEKDHIYLPENGAPSSHILKFPSKDYAYLTENEYFVSQLAKDCGLRMMPQKLLHHDSFTGLLIERYDRVYKDNKLHRLHQEDFCQALGIPYKNKYEEEGGPSFVHSFELVQSESINVIENLEQLLKWIFFNICIGNCDNHGKNLSLLMSEPNRWRLSPFYDLLCTKVYPSLSKKQAMSIGGSFDGANLSAKHWQQLMNEVKYSYKKFTQELCLPIVDTIQIGLSEHLKEFKDNPSYNFIKIISKEVASFTQRAERSLY
ncbi:MAG: HipA domain-containing protein [Pseudobdellovibrionaceae bacterium]